MRDFRSRRAEIHPRIRRQGSQGAVRSVEQGEHFLAGERGEIENGCLPRLGAATILMGGIGGGLYGTKRHVMRVQMVRVPVQTLRTECEDDVWADRPNVRDEPVDRSIDWCADERLRVLG